MYNNTCISINNSTLYLQSIHNLIKYLDLYVNVNAIFLEKAKGVVLAEGDNGSGGIIWGVHAYNPVL
jgi:hypothetical protein